MPRVSIFMVEVMQIWQDPTPCLESKIFRQEATLPAFFFAIASSLVKPSLLNTVCQAGPCKWLRSRCKCGLFAQVRQASDADLAAASGNPWIPQSQLWYSKERGSRERAGAGLNI